MMFAVRAYTPSSGVYYAEIVTLKSEKESTGINSTGKVESTPMRSKSIRHS